MEPEVLILCVLRSGGIYTPWHVRRLLDQLNRHTPGPPIICLTDMDVDFCRTERLRHDWPGWFAKLELFRLPGPALYLDLDVTVHGDLTPMLDLAKQHPMIACPDFMGPGSVNSSVLAWSGDANHLYRAFSADPERHIRRHSKPGPQWSDQAFIAEHWPGPIALWRDLLPGRVLSHKADRLQGADMSRCVIEVFHGDPKPWSIA